MQPDWVDPDRFDVPQADEQQRLLANLITQMNLDKAPLPRFWYLPRGEKAAIVLTGDDHAIGGTPAVLRPPEGRFARPAARSPTGSACARRSYMYPDTRDHDAQAQAYQDDGFEIALHLNTGCADFTPTSLETRLHQPARRVPGDLARASRPPVSNRTHCIVWSDWASQPKVERAHGIRFDTNYYYKGPDGLGASKPGLMTGSGFPQRFGDLDGTMIDVYQSMTQVTDEMDDILPTTTQIHTLLDNALGSKEYWGVFNVILHSDCGDHTRLNDLVAEAQTPRRAGRQLGADAQRGSTAATARRSATSAYSGQPADVLARRRTRAPAASRRCCRRAPATGPLSRLRARRPARLVEPRARSRASTTPSSTPPPAPTRPPTRPTRPRRTITSVDGDRRRRGPRDGDVDDRRAVDLASSSTAAPPRSATSSEDTAPVTEHTRRADRPAARRRPTSTASRSADSRRQHRQLAGHDRVVHDARGHAGGLAHARSSPRARSRTPTPATRSTAPTARCMLQPDGRRGVRRQRAPGRLDLRTRGSVGGLATVGGGPLIADSAVSHTSDLLPRPAHGRVHGDLPAGQRPGGRPRRRPQRLPVRDLHLRHPGRPVRRLRDERRHAGRGGQDRRCRASASTCRTASGSSGRRRRSATTSTARWWRPTTSRSRRSMRPVVSDYGLFGASVKVALAAHEHLPAHPARSPRACSTAGRARNDWHDAHARTPRCRPAPRSPTRRARARRRAAGRELVGLAAVGAGGAIAEPERALHPVPRDAHHEHDTPRRRRCERVQVTLRRRHRPRARTPARSRSRRPRRRPTRR